MLDVRALTKHFAVRGTTARVHAVDDVTFAIRQLKAAPAFTLVAAITLALGIGANSAMFALVDAVLLRPLPLRDPDRLVMLWERGDKEIRGRVAPLNMLDWNEKNRSFEQIAGYFPGVRLRPEPPRMLLVAPALDFHPSNECVLRYFAPEIEVERVGVGGEWQRELKVMFRM